MSGSNIENKLKKAYTKISKILGYPFEVYRSVDYIAPIKPQNYLNSVTVAFSSDVGFDAVQDDSHKQINMFFDSTGYMIGDIFVNTELGKVITLVNKDPLARPQGISSLSKVTISRPSYTTTGGFGPVSVEVAKDIPAEIIQVNSKQDKGALTSEPSKYSSGIQQYNIWIWFPENAIKINDILVDHNGIKSTIQSIEYTPVGYKLTTASTKGS